MKKILFIITCFLMAAGAGAQTQKTIQEINVDGLKVYFRPSAKNIVSARLFVLGGTSNYSLDQQGIESLAFTTAMNGGTVSKSKTQFNTEAEKIGTSFGSSASLDYSEMNMTCLKSAWDQSWNMFADAIMNPRFAPDDFELFQQQMIAAAKQREADPDSYLQESAMSFVYKGRGYEKQPDGSAASLEKLTADLTKSYFKNTIGKARCILVVVGNLTQDDLTAKVKATLAKLPAGSSAKMNNPIKITQGKENVVERDIATNYLTGIFSTPQLTSPDGIPMMVAMDLIDDKLFVEIRTRRGLSYAPHGGLNTSAITSPYGQIYASTDSPKRVIQVMVNLLNGLKENGFAENELTNKKQEFLTTYYMGLQTSAQQSLAIGRWAIRGNVGMYEDFTNRVNAVTVKDLNRVVDQNTDAIVWTYLGHKQDVQTTDFLQTTKYKNKPY
ncbi:MAG: insulinase family protein [Chitinophagales bacterium]|nr:insulinase family protein [Bacteroidota bacterium]MBX7139706.1 insulinase family protein [Chitinophagales bacterium]